MYRICPAERQMCSLPAFCCCRRRYRLVRRDRLSSASTDWRGDRTTLSIRRSRDLTTLTEQSWPIWDLWSMCHKIRTLDRIDSGYCNESQPFVVLFSLVVRQHEQTLDWLVSLDFVDPERIGFYGLSYGGKTAMRVPAYWIGTLSQSAGPISTSGSSRTPPITPATATLYRGV